MSWATANMKLDDNQTQIRGTDINELPVRGDNFSYKSTKQSTSQFRLLQYSFSIFPILSSWRVSYIILLPLGHHDPTLVDHLSPYLSAYPIKHPLWLSMSCGSQGSIVQGSS